jgi:hypothetical protein
LADENEAGRLQPSAVTRLHRLGTGDDMPAAKIGAREGEDRGVAAITDLLFRKEFDCLAWRCRPSIRSTMKADPVRRCTMMQSRWITIESEGTTLITRPGRGEFSSEDRNLRKEAADMLPRF